MALRLKYIVRVKLHGSVIQADKIYLSWLTVKVMGNVYASCRDPPFLGLFFKWVFQVGKNLLDREQLVFFKS